MGWGDNMGQQYLQKGAEYLGELKMNMSQPCDAAAGNANTILGCTEQKIVSRSREKLEYALRILQPILGPAFQEGH